MGSNSAFVFNYLVSFLIYVILNLVQSRPADEGVRVSRFGLQYGLIFALVASRIVIVSSEGEEFKLNTFGISLEVGVTGSNTGFDILGDSVVKLNFFLGSGATSSTGSVRIQFMSVLTF